MIRDQFKFQGTDIESVFYNKAIDVVFNYFENKVCGNCNYFFVYDEKKKSGTCRTEV